MLKFFITEGESNHEVEFPKEMLQICAVSSHVNEDCEDSHLLFTDRFSLKEIMLLRDWMVMYIAKRKDRLIETNIGEYIENTSEEESEWLSKVCADISQAESLLNMAEFFEIPPLQELASRHFYLAHVKGKTAEELREHLQLPDDLTQQEKGCP